jgi:arsenite methyltransferase
LRTNEPSLYEQVPFREAAGEEFRPGGLSLTGELAAACGLGPGAHVLDLGCGVGATATYLAREWGVSVTGVDHSAAFIEEAQERDAGVAWVLGQADRIPCSTGFFDAVFCECFLSAVAEPAQVLSEIHRVLRAGGRLAVSDMYLRNPENAWALRGLPPDTCLHGAVGREAMLAMVEEAGFTVQAWLDRSAVLKAFVARMVFAYGTRERFWNALVDGADGCEQSVQDARPGYYTLVAVRHAETRLDADGA